MTANAEIRVSDFGGDGLRIAYREGTVDERAARPWLHWEASREPIPSSPSDEAILDVGAHIGGFSLLAARLAPDRRVLAVEPCRESFEMLTHNVALNKLENVETARLALAGHSGKARLHHDPAGNWGHSITDAFEGEEQGEEVRCETLTGFLRKKGVERCALAKFNCEGAEFAILLRTERESLRAIRQLQILYHSDLVDGLHTLEELEHHLRSAGFALENASTSRIHGRLAAHRRDDM